MSWERHSWKDAAGRQWTPEAASDVCVECGKTPDAHRPDCGTPLGRHLVQVGVTPDGKPALMYEPYSCGKPATQRGDDGHMRCVQHDRISRGLSGKWTTPSEKANA